jgi:quercetin dioxygenase-like cupin family protein
MGRCGCGTSRRAFILGTLSMVLVAGSARAQTPEPVIEPLGRGRTDHLDLVGGPAEIITVKITLPPGAVIAWHTHPGPVFGIVNAGELTVYQADGCTTAFGRGAAVFVEPGVTHEEHNEGTQPVELVATYAVPEGSPIRVPAAAPEPSVCG